jgi:hypothetical protein
MPRTQEYTAKEVADAIREANGVVQTAANKLGCSAKTVYRYADRYVTVQEAMDESRKDLAGEAEGYLVAMMRDREHPKHYKAVKDIARMYHPDYKDEKKDLNHDGDGFTVEINPPESDD